MGIQIRSRESIRENTVYTCKRRVVKGTNMNFFKNIFINKPLTLTKEVILNSKYSRSCCRHNK